MRTNLLKWLIESAVLFLISSGISEIQTGDLAFLRNELDINTTAEVLQGNKKAPGY